MLYKIIDKHGLNLQTFLFIYEQHGNFLVYFSKKFCSETIRDTMIGTDGLPGVMNWSVLQLILVIKLWVFVGL